MIINLFKCTALQKRVPSYVMQHWLTYFQENCFIQYVYLPRDCQVMINIWLWGLSAYLPLCIPPVPHAMQCTVYCFINLFRHEFNNLYCKVINGILKKSERKWSLSDLRHWCITFWRDWRKQWRKLRKVAPLTEIWSQEFYKNRADIFIARPRIWSCDLNIMGPFS